MNLADARDLARSRRGDVSSLFLLKEALIVHKVPEREPASHEVAGSIEVAGAFVEFLDGLVFLPDHNAYGLSDTGEVEQKLSTLLEFLRIQSLSEIQVIQIATIELSAAISLVLLRDGPYASVVSGHIRSSFVEAANTVLSRLVTSGDLDQPIQRWILRALGDSLDVCSAPSGKQLIRLANSKTVSITRLSKLVSVDHSHELWRPTTLLSQASSAQRSFEVRQLVPLLYATDAERPKAGRTAFSERNGRLIGTAKDTLMQTVLLLGISVALVGLLILAHLRPWPFFQDGWRWGPLPEGGLIQDRGLSSADVVTGTTGLAAFVATICVAIAVTPRLDGLRSSAFAETLVWYHAAGGVARLASSTAVIFGILLFFGQPSGEPVLGPAILATLSGVFAVGIAAAVSTWSDDSSQAAWSQQRWSALARVGVSDETDLLEGQPRRGWWTLVAFTVLPLLSYGIAACIAVIATTPVQPGAGTLNMILSIVILAIYAGAILAVFLYGNAIMVYGSIIARADIIRGRSRLAATGSFGGYAALSTAFGVYLTIYSFAAGPDFASYARPWTFGAGFILLAQIVIVVRIVFSRAANGSVSLAIRRLALRRVRKALDKQ